ncbi:MAG: 2'-5' RNA ligase family protein [Mycobacterium sp.]
MAAHSVELLFDAETDAALRLVWDAMVDAGLPSQARHGNPATNRPHVTLTVTDRLAPEVDDELRGLADRLPLDCVVGAPLLFGTGRHTLARLIVPSADLLALQLQVHQICVPHMTPGPAPHAVPGQWTPHATLARRITVGQVAEAFEAGMPTADLHGQFVALRRWDGDQRVEYLLFS